MKEECYDKYDTMFKGEEDLKMNIGVTEISPREVQRKAEKCFKDGYYCCFLSDRCNFNFGKIYDSCDIYERRYLVGCKPVCRRFGICRTFFGCISSRGIGCGDSVLSIWNLRR